MDTEAPTFAFLVGFVLACRKRANETGLFATLPAQVVPQTYNRCVNAAALTTDISLKPAIPPPKCFKVYQRKGYRTLKSQRVVYRVEQILEDRYTLKIFNIFLASIKYQPKGRKRLQTSTPEWEIYMVRPSSKIPQDRY